MQRDVHQLGLDDEFPPTPRDEPEPHDAREHQQVGAWLGDGDGPTRLIVRPRSIVDDEAKRLSTTLFYLHPIQGGRIGYRRGWILAPVRRCKRQNGNAGWPRKGPVGSHAGYVPG